MLIDEEVERIEPQPREYVNYPNIKQSIGISLYFIMFSVVGGIVAGAIISPLHIKDKAITSAVNMVAYTLAALATIWVWFYRYRTFEGQRYKLKLNRFPVLPLLVSVLMIMTMPVIADPVSIIFPMPDNIKKMFDDMFHPDTYSYITVILIAPLMEETIFRGIILNGLLKKYKPETAIIVSAAIFGGIHLNPWQAIPAFLGGLIMGWMYWKTNSIIPGMVVHFANNLFAMALGLAFPKIDTFKQVLSTPMYIGLFLLCAAILMGGWMFLEQYFENNPTPRDNDEWEAKMMRARQGK